MPKVLVVGGGYAGVAAATALAETGISVELLESRGALGGRVYSTPPSENFPYPADNGPHLFMGCYHETLKLLKRIGSPEPFHWIDPLALSWLLPGGKKVSLKGLPLPAPFHLALGFLFSNAFPLSEKFSLAKALLTFSKKPFAVQLGLETVAQFLDATGQGPATRQRFWIPLCNAVMNVPIKTAPLLGFGEVLHRIFFAGRRDSALAVAKEPLSATGFPVALSFLRDKGASVLFHEGVQAFRAEGKSFELTARSGKTFSGDALLWAVPPSSLGVLWPKGTWAAAESFPKMGKSPIVSVHLILSKTVFEEPLVGLPGANFEWVFNRNANWGWKGKGSGVDSPITESTPANRAPSLEIRGQQQYLSFTASAADSLGRQSEEELTALALKELRERCPRALEATVLHTKVTREMAATFIWNRETDKLRPPCETPFPNIFLAGDWTDTGLPATIEGACLSGHRAAEKVRAYLAAQP
jgi:squalene-associated FAD-dependent desaturase